jgi:predicted AAA+ superfamily ATPase
MARPGPIIVDEVQKAPALLDVIHRLIERRRGWRFILTGSSARKLRRGGVNLLGGRAANSEFFPFLAGELGDHFHLADALRLGLVPGIRRADDPAHALAAYAGLYVREEVQAERLVRNTGDFARFLEAISFSHGAQLSVANVARECEVERKTVESYVAVLEDLLLAERVPPFTKRAQRALTTHPKFFFFDAGVFRSLRPAGPLDRPEEIEGAALEGLVWQHLRAWQSWGAPVKRAIAFWRTRRGVEVDFVVQAPGALTAIEVKNTARVREADLTGLRTFREDYPQAELILLYRGHERLKENGVLCLPVDTFLKKLNPAKPL